MTDYIVPLILFVSMALTLGTIENAYDHMLRGASEGLGLIVSILPALILLLCAVHMLQASGAAAAAPGIHKTSRQTAPSKQINRFIGTLPIFCGTTYEARQENITKLKIENGKLKI